MMHKHRKKYINAERLHASFATKALFISTRLCILRSCLFVLQIVGCLLQLVGSRLLDLDRNNLASGLTESMAALFQLADCNNLQAKIHNLQTETNMDLFWLMFHGIQSTKHFL